MSLRLCCPLLALAACAGPAAVRGADIQPEFPSGHRQVEPTFAQKFMVAAADPRAVEAGLDVLRAGGSAADAAVAVQAMLTLVEPQSSGIGGGAFMLYFDKSSGILRAYDGREMAPKAARPDMFLEEDQTPKPFFDAVVSGHAVGVPGVVAMLEMAHRRHGRLPWASLFDAAIERSETGFKIGHRLFVQLDTDPHLRTVRPAKHYFYQEDGAAKPIGTVVQNPELAASLRAIAIDAHAMYTGSLAGPIAETVQAMGGTLTKEDLAGYRAIERQPLCKIVFEHKVCGFSPPTSGGIAVLQILSLLEAVAHNVEADTTDGRHLLLEASRLAFADRNRYVADADFVEVPVSGLLAPEYLKARAAKIRRTESLGVVEPGVPSGVEIAWADNVPVQRPSTSHFAIVDADGNVVSMTTSIENIFGSRTMMGGFLLNNQLTDFSFLPENDGRPVANRVQPGKRPRSSMSPTIVFDKDGKRAVHAVGSPGGSRIIGYVAQTLFDVLHGKHTLQDAVSKARVINRNGVTEVEALSAPGLDALVRGLEEKGHEVKRRPQGSGLHGITIAPDGLHGAADPRRDGIAAGE